MKVLQIILCALMLHGAVSAQTISGQLKDENNQPMPFATIGVFKISDNTAITGAISDIEGMFTIDISTKGEYRLEISSIGYETQEVKVEVADKAVNIGTIMLPQSQVSLDEVTVTAQRSFIENKPGKQILNVGQDIASGGGNITNVLKVLPAVEVTPKGDISIRGNENIKILINGRQPPYGVDPQTLLKQLPASTIEKIEIITNASAKDDPESAGGAINVITKKNSMDGFNIALQLEAGFDPFRGNAGAMANYKKGNLNTYVTYGYYQEKHIFSDRQEIQYTSDNSKFKQLQTIGEGDYTDNGHLILGGLDYQVNENQILNFELMHNDYKNRWGYDSKNAYFLQGSSDEQITRTINRTRDKVYFTDMTLKYLIDNQEERKLDIVGNYSRGFLGSNRTISEEETDISITTQFIESEGTSHSGELTLDYTQPISENGTIEIGSHNNLILFNAFQEIEIDEEEKTDYDFMQHRNAIYGIYSHTFGNLSASVGARGEYYVSKTKGSGYEKPVNKEYWSFFPNVKMQYNLSGEASYQNLSLSYAKSLRRPTYEELNPVTDYSNPFHLERGNPELNPEFIDLIELGHHLSKGSTRIISTFFVSQTKDVIQRYTELQDNNILLSTYRNHSKSHSFGFELNTKFKPFKWWEISPAGMVTLSRFADPVDKNIRFNKNGYLWNTKLNNVFEINDKSKFQLQANYYGTNKNAYYSRKPYYQVNIGYNRTIFHGIGELTLSITDVFNSGGKEEYESFGRDFDSQSSWKLNSRFFMVGVNIFIK